MFNKVILQKAQEGDQKSIEEICTLTWEPIYRYIYLRVQNRQEAEDIAQETYVKALSYIKKNNIKLNSFTGFLRKVALNILRDKWRMKKRHGPDIGLDAISPEDSSISDDSEIFVIRDMIRSGLEKLSAEQRTVIELRIIQGYSVKDTAKIMARKEGTIRVMQYRALNNLSRFLDKI